MDDNLILRALMGAAGASVLAEIDLEKKREEVEDLRKELDAARAETVEVRRQRNNETDRLNAMNAVSVQQRDEIACLRARLDEERSVSAGLRQQLDAANAAVTLQRAEIKRLNKFVWKVRWADCYIKTLDALAELDAEPTPVAEPIDAEGGA